MLVGRDAELRLIESLLAETGEGRSGSLVVRGDAGIGKTALLEEAAARSRLRTLRCTGVESEYDLPFASLQQLLRPLTGLVERLAEPQAMALRSALGLSADRVAGRLLLGVATLNLISEAAEEGPLLCIVDDLQWVDAPSAQALLFCTRRLEAEGVVMLLAVRNDPGQSIDAAHLPELILSPLADEAARDLVARREVAVQSLDAVVRQAAGNPLALLELSPDRGEGRGATGVEWSFRARIARLPAETRSLLLLAALDGSEEPLGWPQLAELAPPTAALRPAISEGLVADSDRVQFRHPLVRSAVQGTASRMEVAKAHRLLAEVTGDPLARAWHHAGSTEAPDDQVAQELDEAAADAARRGGFASAGGALAEAASFSSNAADRVSRRVGAALAYLNAGRSDEATALADQASAESHDASSNASLASINGAVELLQRGSPARAYELLLGAVRGVLDLDPGQAFRLLGLAISAAFVAGWPERGFADADELVSRVKPSPTPEDRFLRPFLTGMRMLATGEREHAKEELTKAAQNAAEIDDLQFLAWAGMASVYDGDIPAATSHYRRAVTIARANGLYEFLPAALSALARVHISLGEIDDADEAVREGSQLSQQLGQENIDVCFSGLLVRVLALKGQVEACRELAEETFRKAHARGIGVAAADAQLGLSELELGLGNGGEARDLIIDLPAGAISWTHIPRVVRACLIADDRAGAQTALDELVVQTRGSNEAYGQGMIARCRALLAADPDEADPLFKEALEYQQQAPPFERATTQLAYGEFLRRAQRRADARAQLRAALAGFEGLGAELWAATARAELEATGITARKRDPSTLDTLTPQELRIARLVGAGASNREVAAQLFLSPKTVEYHLRKVFLKLGVSSRVELARREFEPAPAGPAAD
jgi:DNA-binding CsgD family transcriptional regulator